MSAINFWGDPCPVCKKPITDRESPYAVVCGACIADAMATVLARRAAELASAAEGLASLDSVPTADRSTP